MVVQTGLLGKTDAADIGVPTLPLGELHGDAGATLLAKLGGQVALSTKVSAIEPDAGRRLPRRAGARATRSPPTRWSWPSRTRRPRR